MQQLLKLEFEAYVGLGLSFFLCSRLLYRALSLL